VITDYAQRLQACGGELYLSGVDESLAARWERSGLPGGGQSIELVRARPLIGESTYSAFLSAQGYLVQAQQSDSQPSAEAEG
jgi:hypothetical protein